MAISPAEPPDERPRTPTLRLVPQPTAPDLAAHEHEWRLVAVDFDDLGPAVRVFECTGCRDVHHE